MWNRVEMIMKYSAILELLAMLLAIQMTQFRFLRSSFSRIKFSFTHQSIEYHCKIYLNQDGCVPRLSKYITKQVQTSRVSSTNLQWNDLRGLLPLATLHKRRGIPASCCVEEGSISTCPPL